MVFLLQQLELNNIFLNLNIEIIYKVGWRKDWSKALGFIECSWYFLHEDSTSFFLILVNGVTKYPLL